MHINFDDIAEQYAALWQDMTLDRNRLSAVNSAARRVMAGQATYQKISETTGVPWVVIGVIHALEAGGNFNCHLHNGDSLQEPTHHVPKGRPHGKGPFTFEESAVDALTFDGLAAVKTWTVERCLYELERYNGFGYRLYHAAIPTPYLWAGTNHYSRGKYTSDGTWSASAVSEQIGAAALMFSIETSLPGSLPPLTDAAVVANTPVDGTKLPKANPPGHFKPLESGTIYGALLKMAGVFVCGIQWAYGLIPEAAEQADVVKAQAEHFARLLNVSMPYVGATAISLGFVIIISRRWSAATEHRIG